MASEVLRQRVRDPRRLLRAALSGLARVRASEQRGDRLDLGEEPAHRRYQSLGLRLSATDGIAPIGRA